MKLSRFITALVTSITVITVAILYIHTTYIHDKILKEQVLTTSNSLSEQIFGSMYQVMKKGWSNEELQEFIATTKHSLKLSNYDIDIYRSKKVSELFGETTSPTPTSLIKEVFNTGKKKSLEEGDTIEQIYPIIAEAECLKCHTNAHIGYTLGVIDIRTNIEKTLYHAEYQYLKFYAFIIPLIIIVVFFIVRFGVKRLDSSLTLIENKMNAVEKVDDFKQLQIENINLGFSELNKLLEHFSVLTQKLKGIAVDKDLLEFEIKLLDKFIITSEVVQDWKEHVLYLLSEVNKVMDAYILFTLFKTDDDSYDIEVFWNCAPTFHQKTTLEEIIHKIIKENSHFSELDNFIINHNVSTRLTQCKLFNISELETQTKSLLLDTPKIGGVVGIGVHSTLVSDPIKHIVIEGILTTLINLVGSIKAISKYTRELEYFATRDPLTGLYNRRVFEDFLNYETSRSSRHGYEFALMIIDCDNFKYINDNHGHATGDAYLQELATTIRKTTRAEDIQCRYGGDEFAIVLPETDLKNATVLAQRLVEKVASLSVSVSNDEEVKGTISVGIAMYPTHAMNAKDLFIITDTLMYKAKDEGKNKVKSPNEEDIKYALDDIRHKTDLVYKAVDEECITPYFQPIKNIHTNEIIIYELLMRIEVDGETISAGEFIEVAESLGIVHKMDYVIIEKAFKYLASKGYRGLLFINLSPKTLVIGEFIDKIKALALRYNIASSRIVFEITERETTKNFSLLERFVKQLKLEGFKFAIDDFGSGFSSFHYVKKFPIDYIKIEGEFVSNMVDDPKDLAFVKSIVELAKDLGIKTVGEFVENEKIYNLSKEIGIDFAQGYHIAKPNAAILEDYENS